MDHTDETLPTTDRPGSAGPWQMVLATVAVVLHLFALWLVTVSGLLAPLWAILALGAVWFAACLPLWRGLRARSPWAVAVPLGVLVVWTLVMVAGDVLLGWTA